MQLRAWLATAGRNTAAAELRARLRTAAVGLALRWNDRALVLIGNDVS
ncbi:MAG: hypothetical protein IPK26_24975 [Planctomycetes bacterium]|nr:hypothetical protein [Planctomycetota bacterium]